MVEPGQNGARRVRGAVGFELRLDLNPCAGPLYPFDKRCTKKRLRAGIQVEAGLEPCRMT
jgi:hypothetical protein